MWCKLLDNTIFRFHDIDLSVIDRFQRKRLGILYTYLDSNYCIDKNGYLGLRFRTIF